MVENLLLCWLKIYPRHYLKPAFKTNVRKFQFKLTLLFVFTIWLEILNNLLCEIWINEVFLKRWAFIIKLHKILIFISLNSIFCWMKYWLNQWFLGFIFFSFLNNTFILSFCINTNCPNRLHDSRFASQINFILWNLIKIIFNA